MDTTTTAERRYDTIYNEGGEGYNPHRHTMPAHGPMLGPMTRDETRIWLTNELNTTYQSSDSYRDRMRANRADWRSTLDAIEAAEKAEGDAEWTIDVTRALRVEFNAALSETTVGGRVNPKRLNALLVRLGYTMTDLKAAIERHRL